MVSKERRSEPICHHRRLQLPFSVSMGIARVVYPATCMISITIFSHALGGSYHLHLGERCKPRTSNGTEQVMLGKCFCVS